MRLTIGLLAFLFATTVYAQDQSAQTIIRVATPFFVAWGLAYVTRRRAVGGWLFYFYLNFFGKMALSVLMAQSSVESVTENPDLENMYWWLTVLEYLLYLIATIFTWFFGVKLLFKTQRRVETLQKMRYALAALFILNLIRSYISYSYFPGDSVNGLTYFSTLTSGIWCAYWLLSKRVRYVMTRGNEPWDYETFKREIKLS